MLVGQDGPGGQLIVNRVVASPNLLAAETNDRFQIDPQIQIDLFRQLRDTDQRIIGHYHSHPDHPAEPSKTDLEKAWEPELVWLIVEVSAGEAKKMKTHRINPATGQFEEIHLAVSDNAG